MTQGELPYRDRAAGGEALSRRLLGTPLARPLVVLALPRGGLPTALVVARRLNAPLDVLTVRKIGHPDNSELAIGAVAGGGAIYRDPLLGRSFGITDELFQELAGQAQEQLRRREQLYRRHLAELDLAGQTAVLVDDGLATGATMMAAIKGARSRGAARVIVAAPVASHEAVHLLQQAADAVVIANVPPALSSVGEWYEQFDQVSDEEAISLLRTAAAEPRRSHGVEHIARSAS